MDTTTERFVDVFSKSKSLNIPRSWLHYIQTKNNKSAGGIPHSNAILILGYLVSSLINKHNKYPDKPILDLFLSGSYSVIGANVGLSKKTVYRCVQFLEKENLIKTKLIKNLETADGVVGNALRFYITEHLLDITEKEVVINIKTKTKRVRSSIPDDIVRSQESLNIKLNSISEIFNNK